MARSYPVGFDAFMAHSVQAVCREIDEIPDIQGGEIFDHLNTILLRNTGRQVTFFCCESRDRRFPQIFRTAYNSDIVNVRYFVQVGSNADTVSEDVLRQLSISVVLVCSPIALVDDLSRNETYASFSKRHQFHAKFANKLYQVLINKVQIG